MKTAISVPDVVFSRVEVRVGELGISRSEFFTRAAERYLKDLDDSDLTQRFDEALERTGIDETAGVGASGAFLNSLPDEDW